MGQPTDATLPELIGALLGELASRGVDTPTARRLRAALGMPEAVRTAPSGELRAVLEALLTTADEAAKAWDIALPALHRHATTLVAERWMDRLEEAIEAARDALTATPAPRAEPAKAAGTPEDPSAWDEWSDRIESLHGEPPRPEHRDYFEAGYTYGYGDGWLRNRHRGWTTEVYLAALAAHPAPAPIPPSETAPTANEQRLRAALEELERRDTYTDGITGDGATMDVLVRHCLRCRARGAHAPDCPYAVLAELPATPPAPAPTGGLSREAVPVAELAACWQSWAEWLRDNPGNDQVNGARALEVENCARELLIAAGLTARELLIAAGLPAEPAGELGAERVGSFTYNRRTGELRFRYDHELPNYPPAAGGGEE